MANVDNNVTRNTPKGIDAAGNADVPSTYKVEKFECLNKNGSTIPIADIVTSFTISEELFSPVMVLNMRIRDSINFFEDYALNGQERIHIKLRHISPGVPDKTKEKSIDLHFSVKEYPNYVKSLSEPNVQEYNIIAVSDIGYTSMLTRISRSVKGNPIEGIQKILKEDLGTTVRVDGVCASVFDGIITTQSPLKAVEWLRSKAFDSNGSPFFVYSSIAEKDVIITSLTDIWSSNNKVFRIYDYRQFLKATAGTLPAYQENASRILDMKSNIKLDKLEQANKGAFASVTNVTDVSNKSFVQAVFDYGKDPTVANSRLSVKELFSGKNPFSFGATDTKKATFNELPNASISNISANTNSNYNGNQNSTGAVRDNISRAKSYYANLDAVSHQIQVYGDFGLNPGKKVTIKIPKSVDQNKYRESHELFDFNELDESMSGDYVVAVVAHTFQGGIYTSKVKIIKDA